MTFQRPTTAPPKVISLAPPVVSGKRTQVLTSDVIRPVLRVPSRPPPPSEPPPHPVEHPPSPVEPPAAPANESRDRPPTWTLERKLLAANMVLGVVVLFEFLVL